MKQIITILAVLLLILAFGCAKPIGDAPEGPVQIQVPELGQVEHAEEQPAAQETAPEAETGQAPASGTVPTSYEPSTTEEEPEPIGSRLSEEAEVSAASDMPEDAYGVMLYSDKTMSEEALTIKSGEEVYYRNMDTFPHQLLVEQENPDSSNAWEKWNLIVKSDRLNEGESWIYQFDVPGTYVVRDTFSGTMRMTVIVE
jgi:plastocyanin